MAGANFAPAMCLEDTKGPYRTTSDFNLDVFVPEEQVHSRICSTASAEDRILDMPFSIQKPRQDSVTSTADPNGEDVGLTRQLQYTSPLLVIVKDVRDLFWGKHNL